MPLDDIGRKVRDAGSAGARQALAVSHVELVRGHPDVRELAHEVIEVQPQHAALEALHETGPGQDKGACADPDQRHVLSRRPTQELDGRGTQAMGAPEQATGNNDVVEISGIREGLPGADLDAATRFDGFQVLAQQRPGGVDRAAAVAFVGGEAQRVDERGEGRQREFRHQHEGDAELGRRHLGFCPIGANCVRRSNFPMIHPRAPCVALLRVDVV